MLAPLETIVRAACGDGIALADIAYAPSYDRDAIFMLTAVVVSDPDPHPLAAIAALALQARPSRALCAVARSAQSAAADLLEQESCADLRAALAPWMYRVWNALAEPSDPDAIAACARLAMKINAAAVADLLERIGAAGWKQTPPETRAALLLAVTYGPKAAAFGGGAVWAALEPDERVRIALGAARESRSVADLLERIGAAGWKQTPPEARAALLRTMEADTEAVVRGGGAVWAALEPDERARFALLATLYASFAADLLERIGAAGWEQTPPAARETLLQAINSDPWTAARGGGAVWAALDNKARARVASSAARRAETVADLLERIGAAGWEQTPPAARAALLRSIGQSPKSASRGGGAVWTALDDKARARVARSSARHAEDAADLLERIGAAGWAQTPPEARETLLRAICAEPYAAARGGGAVWTALEPDERVRIAQTAGNTWSAADLLERIGAAGWEQTPPATRAALLRAICSEPYAAVRGGEAVWTALNDKQRAMLARRASAANLMVCIGPDGWRIAPENARRALLDAVSNVPGAAARGGGAVWTALEPDERARVAQSAARSAETAADLLERLGEDGWALATPDARDALLNAAARDAYAAVRAISILSDVLDDDARECLLRAAAPGDGGSIAVAQALARGCYWRYWMARFVPDHAASGDTVARWIAVLHRLPASVAARLPIRRPLRR